MTLLLGMVNRTQAMLVADRRLSVDGRLTEDESNKAATPSAETPDCEGAATLTLRTHAPVAQLDRAPAF